MRWSRVCVAASLPLLVAVGCGGVQPSIREFAAELPARADGQYAPLDLMIRKQLIMKDALLQCKIDLEDGRSEQQSASCRCAESASDDWLSDCRTWLGPHTPSPEPEAPTETSDGAPPS